MNYGAIYNCDTTNGLGVRVSLFVSGCHFHCKKCFNEVAWDKNYGKLYTEETKNKLLKLLSPTCISGITILGGEPFEEYNINEIYKLITDIRNTFKDSKNIWIYTGYLYEDLINDPKRNKILNLIDTLVDGPFEIDKKNLNLKFRGSSNQRIINVKESLKQNKVVLLDL